MASQQQTEIEKKEKEIQTTPQCAKTCQQMRVEQAVGAARNVASLLHY